MRNSHHNPPNTVQAKPPTSVRPKTSGAVCLPLVFSLMGSPLLAQEKGKKVEPSSSGTIDVREIEKREKQGGQQEERKKVENQNLEVPRGLPVPKGAKGKTFKPRPTAKKKAPRTGGNN